MDELNESANKEEVFIKTEIDTFSDAGAILEDLISTKCGIIFICSDSSFYINCIVDDCSVNKNFYEINKFLEHITTNHQNTITDNIIANKVEPSELSEESQILRIGNNNKYTKDSGKKESEKNVKAKSDKNPLEIIRKEQTKINEKDLECKMCNKVFLKPTYLKKHLKRHALKPTEKVICSVCNKSFKYASHLRLHMVIHNNSKSSTNKNEINKPVTSIKEEISEHKDNIILENQPIEGKEDDIKHNKSNYLDINNENISENNSGESISMNHDIKPLSAEYTEHITTSASIENISNNNDENVSTNAEKSQSNKKLTRTCHICNKTFQSRKYLRRHILLHNNIKPVKIIPCLKCHKIFKYEHHLRFHMVVHDVEHKCPDCDKVFHNRSSLQRHIVCHMEIKPFKCELCNSKFSLKETLQRHKKKVHDAKIYGCSECVLRFYNKDQLHSHCLSVHGMDLIEFSKFEISESTKKQQIHQCGVCTKIFKTNRILKRHMRTHNKKSDDPIPCPKCKKSFKYEHHLKMHIVIHDKVHKCSECGKIYANRPALVNHMQYHGGERQLKCELCDTWCFTKIQLRRHFIDAHSEKKYECEHCGKKFRKKHILTCHIRTHTKEKPLVCEVCGMGFFTPFLLNNHLKRHNNQRDFKCNFEGCNKNFFTRVALVDHEVTHTKLKPFFCKVEGCNSRFTLRSGLVKHKKLHSNVKNYICKICGKAYAQSPGLYAHMKTHGQPLPSV